MLDSRTVNTIGGDLSAPNSVTLEHGFDTLELVRTEALSGGRDLGSNGLAMIGQCDELHRESGTSRVATEVPQSPKRLCRGQRLSLTFEAMGGAAPEEGQKEIVHGPEVVIDELGFQSRFGRDTSGCDCGVALLEHELLGCLEQGATGLRGLRADATLRARGAAGRGQMYIPPLTPDTTCLITLRPRPG